MIQLLLILAGTIGLAADEQFHGQQTIAIVCLSLGVFLVIINLLVLALAAWKVNSVHRDFRRNF